MKLVGKIVRWDYTFPMIHRHDYGEGVVLAVEFANNERPNGGTASHWKLLVQTELGLKEVFAEWVKEIKDPEVKS